MIKTDKIKLKALIYFFIKVQKKKIHMQQLGVKFYEALQ